MLGIINYETFLIAGILLNLTPGADTMYILSRSIAEGKKVGILSALGISTGSLIHCICAALGLSIILAKSALAFEIVKYLGAAYLIFLGIKSIVSSKKSGIQLTTENGRSNYKKVYVSGILTNVLNPKVALFFLAFLPQFIVPNYANSSTPFLILGLTFLATGTVWCMLLAVFASKFAARLQENVTIKQWLDRMAGSVFIILGIKIALSKQ